MDGGNHRAEGELADLVGGGGGGGWGEGLANFFCTGPDSNYFRLVDISDSVDVTQFCFCSVAAIEICK